KAKERKPEAIFCPSAAPRVISRPAATPAGGSFFCLLPFYFCLIECDEHEESSTRGQGGHGGCGRGRRGGGAPTVGNRARHTRQARSGSPRNRHVARGRTPTRRGRARRRQDDARAGARAVNQLHVPAHTVHLRPSAVGRNRPLHL